MDSRFHATVMRRAEDEQEEAVSSIRRDGIMNGPSTTSASGSNTIHGVASPRQQSQTEIRSILNPSTFSPGAHPQFNQYHQPTAAPQLVQPAHTPLQPASASALGLSPPLYQKERDSTYQRDQKPPSNYYDPTSDSSERRPTVTESLWSDREAKTSQNRESYPYNQNQPPESSANGSLNQYNGGYTSPVNSHFPPRSPISHAHPQGRVPPPVTQSPRLTTMESPVSRHNGVGGGPVQHDRPVIKQEPVPASTPSRPADPMSFSSILSSAAPEPTPTPKPQPTPTPVVSKPRKPARQAMPTLKPEPSPAPSSRQSSIAPAPPPPATTSRVPAKRKANGEAKSTPKPKPFTKDQERDIVILMSKLDGEPGDSDMEFAEERKLYKTRSLKRKIEVENLEIAKTKKRRTDYSNLMTKKMSKHAKAGEERYREVEGDAAISKVQADEIQTEKERKKDMQRKRRREKTVQHNMEAKELALAKAKEALDDQDRNKFLRDAQRAEKKAQQTKLVLARGDRGPEIRAVSPMEPNMQGGSMSTFTAVDPDSTKKPKRGGARPRKSKEQKQAEKDSAAAAQEAIDKGESPALMPIRDATEFKDMKPLPSKEGGTKIKLKLKAPAEPVEVKEESPPAPVDQHNTKMFHVVYDQIWKDLARKEVPKVFKMAMDSYSIRGSNLKKTAILASKEAKRWQLRTNKGTKDLQARAKRVMREMMSFWKRNEREERDTRRAAEKQEIENAKKAEADREANRQKRKLNFLISQTELYSHFIGKKIKTDEVERSTDHPDVAAPAEANHSTPDQIDLPEGSAPAKVTNFEDLDFDAEDESVLKAAAMANAQNAIQEAQNKARAFNKQDDAPAMDNDGEMNFQNPAGMGDVDIEQPKMLQAQLKEYQLKGLNWLVNLYEQGINGILADEMGLGKTVQSISVMAYLAEKHGIWGPFLVVAPASTLHNWQQEITKFVPKLKVLPYWGTAADRKVLRKFWDRKHITYTEEAPFHVLITSYQLVVSDVAYFQKMKWQYMILDEAQAIKSSQSSRWKSLLGFHCRNRLLLTGTPIQNNMQELWALLHFIMPSLFDSHDEFSEWFSKDIESHAQSNTKLNEDQLKRLHMILKPFMLRRVKKHVQKELGDKIEEDIFCDLTYRQRAYYSNLRNQISIMDLIEKATIGDDNDTGTLMNLVMQFRKVCNHPDLFERAETTSPLSFSYFAEAGSFLREGPNVTVAYSARNLIQYSLPRLIWREGGRLDLPGHDNEGAGVKAKCLESLFNVWKPENIVDSSEEDGAFSWLRFTNTSVQEASAASSKDLFARAVDIVKKPQTLGRLSIVYDEEEDKNYTPAHAMLQIVDRNDRKPLAEVTNEGYLNKLFNVAKDVWDESGISRMEQCGRPSATAPPIEVDCSSRGALLERQKILFNVSMRRALFGPSPVEEKAFITSKVSPSFYPPTPMLPVPTSEKQRFTNIKVPSMRRFVTDSGKLAKLDALLTKLKEGGHRVLLYFQMTRMIDLMEEYLTYRNYKYLRLDGSTKLEDRRDTVHDFQTRPEIFIFLLSTRAGGLGINLTSADTVIFYDSDWNPTIDSQAMDRAHRLGQTRQVTVYRMITRGTIEERIRKRALQKEEVQKVVMTGGAGGGVDFNARSKENRTKDIAMWLVDDEEAAEIERKAAEQARYEAENPNLSKKGKGKGKKAKEGAGSLEDLYHEGEGHFDDGSNRPSGTATPIAGDSGTKKGSSSRKTASGGRSKKAKTAKERLAMADGDVDMA
ncbi:similar to SNF2 family helicase/ATPase (Ino80) [Botrytis cinerea T4]|uniref:Chromatin-remodeling ATPase INO80 n=1 Tax=Botryotinia fuckeliana (strain T4) TaxID=999810 RepID=G2YRU7_BOTF4|nr:similar to SNF2 family helicase/ATPase (Ino80) [Botrytis cinerea T4]